MSVKQLLDAGALRPAIDQVTQELRSRPADTRSRTLLFELLCYAGEWARAEKQLDILGGPDADPKLQVGVQVYRNMIEAERKRAALFDQGVRPRFMLEPPPDVLRHLEAVELVRLGRHDEARQALDQAAEESPAVTGTLDGTPIDEVRDADDLLAPVLEVFTAAGYFWVPWSQIQFLSVPEPVTLRDLLWTPARLASFDGQLGEVYLPALYPGTARAEDDAVRLGRRTDWEELPGGLVRGVGRKLVLAGDQDRSLSDLRELVLTPPASEA